MTSATSADSLPGPKVAAAIATEVLGGNRPDAILVGATYDGRDIAARMSVRLDLPVLTNIIGLEASEEGLTTSHAVFGGSVLLRARLSGGGPGIFVVRAKSFVPEPIEASDGSQPPATVAIELRGDGRHGLGEDRRPPRGGAQRAKARRSRHRGVGRARTRVGGELRPRHRACPAAQRRGGGVARDRRRGLGALRASRSARRARP